MSKILDVAIDTCVFFKMIEYNNFVEAYGEKYLSQLITLKEKELKDIKTDIRASLGTDFFKKYENLPFEHQIEKYKSYATNIESRCLNGMNEAMELANNAQTEEDQMKYFQIYENYYNQLNALLGDSTINENLIKINEYRMQKDIVEVGKIYQAALNGEFDLYCNFIAFDEVLYHTQRRDNPHFLTYDLSEVNALTDRVVKVVSTKSQDVLDIVDMLAQEYRTGNGRVNEKPMDADVNSLDEFGDSKIAAFSNLTGMILITLNGKDFIFDKGYRWGNDNIRKHLQYTNSKYDFTTDASVYSPKELLEGKVNTPQIQSKILNYVDISENSTYGNNRENEEENVNELS
ncbi:MAG: hypothetical protein IJX17_06725 [Clostridia bacterium]|nr:hypothetical protein [Clostridia bacterium]